jgi:hypothetical protein
MKVLVCGSRDFDNYRLVDEVLDANHRIHKITELIEGGALGADRFARIWAQNNYVPFRTFHADWALGAKAGPLRNAQMLKEGKPDKVFAFINKPWEHSRGTRDMVRKARKASVDVLVIEDPKGVGS